VCVFVSVCVCVCVCEYVCVYMYVSHIDVTYMYSSQVVLLGGDGGGSSCNSVHIGRVLAELVATSSGD